MGIRDSMSKYPKISAGIACGGIIVAIAYTALSMTHTRSVVSNGKAWFTTDDGATFTTADRSLVPPFDRDGRTFYGLEIISEDGGKTKSVAYLYRYTTDVHDRVRDLIVNGVKTDPRFEVTETARRWEEIDQTGKEVKRPKDPVGKWVKATSPEGVSIMKVSATSVSVAP